MNKVLAWVLGFTKIGKVLEPVQRFLSGKKSYIAGLSIFLPAFFTMIGRFTDQGLPYLMSLPGSPELIELMNGIAIMGVRAAITKAAEPAADPNKVG